MKPVTDNTVSKSQRRKQAAELHNANYEYRQYVGAQESGLARIKAQAALEKELNDKEEQEAKKAVQDALDPVVIG